MDFWQNAWKNCERGQSLVEMAIILPLLLVILTGIIQFGIIFNGQIAVNSAAREGARLAAVGATDDEIENRVKDVLTGTLLLNYGGTFINPPGSRSLGEKVSVEVSAGAEIIVPFLDLLVGEEFNLSSRAVMRVEYAGGGG